MPQEIFNFIAGDCFGSTTNSKFQHSLDFADNGEFGFVDNISDCTERTVRNTMQFFPPIMKHGVRPSE